VAADLTAGTLATWPAVALGVDLGLNTLLSAGAVRLHETGTITALGAGGMFRAAGAPAKQHRLRRLSEPCMPRPTTTSASPPTTNSTCRPPSTQS
jgi:hypothetical protein